MWRAWPFRVSALSHPGSSPWNRRSLEPSLACSQSDRHQHLGQVFSNRLIWESNHPISGQGEDRLSFSVPILLRRMNSSIELDHQTALRTPEVNNEGTDRMLPTELHSIQPPSAEFFP
jgi:hypothetical protein